MADNQSKVGSEMSKHPDQALSDDPEQAVESGEPRLTGRTHGRQLDAQGAPVGTDEVTARGTDDPRQAPESGRHGEDA